LAQPAKVALEIRSIDGGMQMKQSDEQPKKADSPTCDTLQPVSKVKTERVLQPLKHELSIVSTDFGTQID
jgi:hypothetical protein